MCGINAVVGVEDSEARQILGKMTASLLHRGPDANGIVQSEECSFGHTRLSIIDLDTGTQPMTSAGGRYMISFNGEIYNFRKLKNDLVSRGYKFRTSSDTEVILASYDAWGDDCLNHFRGMFAFVIWDNQKKELFVARDLFGEKPVYFAEIKNNGIVVASEIKALIAGGLVSPKIDFTSVDAYLAFGYVPPDRTIYANVHTLPPGHFLYWKSGVAKIQRYWQPSLKVQSISLNAAAVRTRQLLQQAVTRQMVADVPVGAFLSGGIDSSTIVALMQRQSNRPVKTFSVGFGDYINELPYANAVAKKYGTEHHEINLGVPNVSEMLLRMADVYDEPFADTSNIPTYLISEFARKYVKVVLSGDGGDELFGGYSWTYPALVKSGKVPDSMMLWIVLRSISKLCNHRWKSLALYSAGCGLASRGKDFWQRQVMQSEHFKTFERRRLWGDRLLAEDVHSPGQYYAPSDKIEGVNRGFYFDLMSYLPGDILVKVDRASMAHGLETRAPFLDRDLVEFALSLPVNLKVSDRQTKVLLKQACQIYWPDAIKNRDKRGFGAPINGWLKFSDVVAMKHRVFSPQSPLRALLPGLTDRYAQKNDYQTWILFVLGLWLERHKEAL